MLDSGEWGYWSYNGSICAGPNAPVGQRERVIGDIWIMCSHADSKGTAWTTF